VLGVLRQQHRALDMMLAQRAAEDPKFLPTRSGPVWDAVIAGHNTIVRLQAEDKVTAFYKCPVCQAISYHPQDIEYGYCGRCNDFTGKLQMMARSEA
jgi:hypothetical protein